MQADEMVDIVNSNGDTLFTTTRTRAHQEGLLHKTVLALVHTLKGDWILVQQPVSRQDPGVYIPPMGGHVEAGESHDDAMKREVAEELGITDYAHTQLGTFTFARHVLGRHENHYFIVYRVDTAQPFTTNHEISSHKTLTEAELARLVHTAPERFGPTLFLALEHFYPHMLTK